MYKEDKNANKSKDINNDEQNLHKDDMKQYKRVDAGESDKNINNNEPNHINENVLD